MAFQKKAWLKRLTEYPNRRKLIKSDGSSEIVTVERVEGTVSQEGDAFSEENMNDLEQRIENEFNALNSDITNFIYTIAYTHTSHLNILLIVSY